MASEENDQFASRDSGGGSAECKPLLDTSTRELFQNNAFRITGLPVDATAREIAKHADKVTVLDRLGIVNPADKLKVLEQLGLSGHAAAFPLEVPPTPDQIREAFQKLNRSPDQRMVDEFFWFWPAEFGKSSRDPAIQALAAGKVETASQIWAAAEADPADGVVGRHNLAVLWHLRALDLENERIDRRVDATRPDETEEAWRNALKRWQALIADDALWDKVASRIRQFGDASLTTGFARRMRSTLGVALSKINAELALTYARAGKMDLAKAHVQFVRETGAASDAVARAEELVLAPAIAHLRNQIKRAGEQAQAHPETADQAARALIEATLPLVNAFDLFFGEAEHPAKDLPDEAATACVNCLVAYHQPRKNDNACVEWFERTLALARADHLRRLIQGNIDTCKRNLVIELLQAIRTSAVTPRERLKRFETEAIGPLREATANPDSKPESRKGSLDHAASVLNDIAVDAWNKTRDKSTAIRAIDLALQYVCDPELKTKFSANREIFTRKKPPAKACVRKAAKGSRKGCWFVFAVWLIFSIINSCQSKKRSPGNRSDNSSGAVTVSVEHVASLPATANPSVSKTS
ncbi:MAG: hypothetical protein JO069_06415 [Verrucomicrobia bacterium]|nr:hypothetical protein [Verrucomicrobiota bacterium]